VLPAFLVVAFVGGLSLRSLAWVSLGDVWLVSAGVLASCLALATRARRPLSWFLASAIGAGCWGALLAPPAPDVQAYRSLQRGLARLTFEVTRSGCGEQGCWSEARLLRCVELEAHSCAPPGQRLGVGSAEELPLGATVTALGTLKLRPTFRNPTPATIWPDVRPALQASLHGGARPRIDAIARLDAGLAAARGAIRAALARSLSPPHAGIARALLLGEGGAVERELNDAIRNAGVSHVLAVSGMHVTLLVGALVACVRTLWLRTPLAVHWEARRAAAALGVLLAPLIARLCGAAPSAVRAAWTSTLMYLVVALGWRPCALSVAALIVGVHATLSPFDALHPGFVLSVLATAALLTHRRGEGALRAAFLESLRAWLATAPFLLLCFGQTSFIAVLANVALLPLGGALVPLVALHCANAMFALERELPTGPLFELASGAFVEAARLCSQIDPGFTVPPMMPLEVSAAALFALGFMLPCSWRLRALLGTATLAVIVGSEWSLRSELAAGELRVTFLDVGQGDSALLETREGKAALIDAGGSIGGGPDPGKHAVLPLLRARRIARLEYVVLSHPHPDHYGGLLALLDALPIGELWDTGQAEAESAEHGDVARLLARARERGVRVRRPHELCGKVERLGAARLSVLAPCPAFDTTRGANDNSFVIRVEHGARSFLFTGDVERAGEAELSEQPQAALRSDVLKVAHHGSRTSSTARLLARVQPRLAVVSAGIANPFGHPHAEVVARLAQAAPHLLRTDVHGGVEVRSDGRVLTVRAWDPTVRLRLYGDERSLPDARHHQDHTRDRTQQQDRAGEPH
jgi:competence protein ComEC